MPSTIKMRLQLPKITEVMDKAMVESLDIFAGDCLDLIDGQIWKGFKYGKYYPPEQMGTSQENWYSDQLEKGKGGFTRGFVLYNYATIQARTGTYEPVYWGRKSGITKSYKNTNAGEYYAGYVQKSGDSQPLWMEVQDQIEEKLLPDFETELLINILDSVGSSAETVELRADRAEVGTYNFEL